MRYLPSRKLREILRWRWINAGKNPSDLHIRAVMPTCRSCKTWELQMGLWHEKPNHQYCIPVDVVTSGTATQSMHGQRDGAAPFPRQPMLSGSRLLLSYLPACIAPTGRRGSLKSKKCFAHFVYEIIVWNSLERPRSAWHTWIIHSIMLDVNKYAAVKIKKVIRRCEQWYTYSNGS